MQGFFTLGVKGLGVDLRLCEEDADDVDVSLLDGEVEGVVAAVVHGGEVHVVAQQDGGDGRQVGLGRHVQARLLARVASRN